MGIIDDLLQHPGLYLGIDHDSAGRGESAARMRVTPLPGGAGVTLDYETFNTNPNRVRGHHEHAILARTHGGSVIMVSGHIHADSVAVLHETSPGIFELGDDSAPFPMKIVISVPEPGQLVHSWWYGPAGGTAEERDRAELRLQPGT
jgi:hypothetical protein